MFGGWPPKVEGKVRKNRFSSVFIRVCLLSLKRTKPRARHFFDSLTERRRTFNQQDIADFARLNSTLYQQRFGFDHFDAPFLPTPVASLLEVPYNENDTARDYCCVAERDKIAGD